MTVSNSCDYLNSGPFSRNAGNIKLCCAGNCQEYEENSDIFFGTSKEVASPVEVF